MTALRPSHASILTLLAASAAGQAGTLFDTPLYLPESAPGELGLTGDFDGDGHVDLVHFDEGLTIFVGDGAGGFAPQATLSYGSPASGTYKDKEPIRGDFDGDGKLDVAVDRRAFSLFGGDVVVYFGDGAGGFGASAEAPAGLGVTDIFAGQCDSDAASEILLRYTDSSYQRYLTWLDWQGTGFVASAALPIGGSSDPAGTFAGTVGDFDGDGDDDFAATSVSPHDLVRIFPTVDGAPTFGPSFPAAPSMQYIGHRLRAGDLDGDGDVDLLHVKEHHSSHPGLWFQAYENVAGALMQRNEQLVETPGLGSVVPASSRLGDWDGDGWLDLFSLHQGLDIVRSNGDWTYSEGGHLYDGSSGLTAGVADVDGDGRNDFVGRHTIHFGDQTFDGATGPMDGAVEGDFPDGFQPEDFGGDGDVDLVGGNLGWRNENDGTGRFTLFQGSGGALFPSAFPDPPAAGTIYGGTVAFADFTGDGRDDYLARLLYEPATPFTPPSFAEMRLLAGDPAGEYVHAGSAMPPGVDVQPPGVAPDAHWDAADADGDGDVDLLVDDGYWRNAGAGAFHDFVGTAPGRVFDAADVEGDGDVDLLARTSTGDSSQIWIQRNDGGGATTSVAVGALAGGAAQARFVDLDGDGDLDVAAADPDGEELLLAQDVGAGFGAPVLLPATVPNLRMLGVLDANGDGVLDLVTQRLESKAFSPPVTILTEYHRAGPGLDYSAVRHFLAAKTVYGSIDGFADIDGDGDLDLTGTSTLLNLTVQAPDGGVVQQFGEGSPGAGGIVPVLGAQGPVTSSNPCSEVRVTGAPGGSLAFVVVSALETALAGVPFPGMTLYVDGPAILGPLSVSGAPGQAGTGSLAVPLPKIPQLHGLTFVHQAFLFDASSLIRWSSSGGLRITYGL